MAVVLHQCRPEGVLERLPILQGDVGHSLHGVEVLSQADWQSGIAKLLNEAADQVQQGPVSLGLAGDRRLVGEGHATGTSVDRVVSSPNRPVRRGCRRTP